MVVATDAKRHTGQVARALKREFPDVQCALGFRTPLQLLVATILSAQCTDVRVNMVTKDLFKRFPTAAHFAKVPIKTLEKAIRSTGFFRNKAKNIKACCRRLVDEYDGQVPRDMDLLVELPGVGRKTANVVLGTAYGLATGVVVDTHVGRLAKRLALTTEKTPEKIELALQKLVPRDDWMMLSHWLIFHGRRRCSARKPECAECEIAPLCPSEKDGEYRE